ncbi:DMT family transporter [Paenibacillus hexagrammi]|uniref:DMT family transporter n=1 Tax=Paenibacillus hexagrammi TaxID=2908839 RepID=A0ABY3SE67_9BACL|nr:DMT family transporter [Paenibacillus sp. YPD9-1]UJF32283.1 DMT family transporter [Paenibacillus sp. YPD9-1]
MSTSSSQKLLPHLGFVLVYVLWGINMTSMKIGGTEWDPLVFNGLRFASMIPILWVYTYFYYRSRSLQIDIQLKDFLLVCGLGILNAVGMESLLQYALQFSNAANGAVLGRGFMPVITVIIALATRQVKLTWRIMVGIPLALGSVIVIVSGGAGGFHIGADTFRGDILLLMRSVMGAVYLIGMNRLVSKYPLPLLISLEMTAGAAALLPFVFYYADTSYFAAISKTGWFSLIYTSMFATALGFSIHNWSLGRLGAFKSSAYGYLLPITAALAGFFVLHESISLYQCIGGAGVLTAMYLVQRDRGRSPVHTTGAATNSVKL